MRPPRLTELAQHAVGEVLGRGDRAVDATVGNGHDTLFLARQVGPDGRVIGFDIQRQALDAAHRRLQALGLAERVTLRQCGHERMATQVPPDWSGAVAAVMFNLGYLPGGDRGLVTRAESSVAALEQGLRLLCVGGLVSLLVYRGHVGARAEAGAVDAWIGRLDAGCRVTRHDSPGPLLYLVERLG